MEYIIGGIIGGVVVLIGAYLAFMYAFKDFMG